MVRARSEAPRRVRVVEYIKRAIQDASEAVGKLVGLVFSGFGGYSHGLISDRVF